jgi:LPS export ABC transporter protein LptC
VIGRILFLVAAVAVLVALLYMQEPESSNPANSSAQTQTAEPGFVALGAQIIETGDNGEPLYTLDATRIEQPMPQGDVYLTNPVLHYEPAGGNAWVLTAQQGQLPQNGHTADLSGNVTAQGKPPGSPQIIHFNTSQLHVDMQQQLATTAARVHVDWAMSLLTGRGMRADLKSGELQLFKDVRGVLTR